MSSSPTWRKRDRPSQPNHLRIMALAEAAAQFAREVLAAGSTFLCKVLQGGKVRTAELSAISKRQAR